MFEWMWSTLLAVTLGSAITWEATTRLHIGLYLLSMGVAFLGQWLVRRKWPEGSWLLHPLWVTLAGWGQMVVVPGNVCWTWAWLWEGLPLAGLAYLVSTGWRAVLGGRDPLLSFIPWIILVFAYGMWIAAVIFAIAPLWTLLIILPLLLIRREMREGALPSRSYILIEIFLIVGYLIQGITY
ncbi:MAG: hypothetical protein JXA33_08480 [Anaerolineae bacterium]|nr:hypothetical protein [Anaerolineae bacterium]